MTSSELVDEGNALWEAGDLDGAYEIYVRAAEEGSVAAMVNLAQLVSDRDGRDTPETLSLWRRAAEAGDPEAMSQYGILIYSQDPAAAEEWLRKSHEAGDADGTHNLIILLVARGQHSEARKVWDQQEAPRKYKTAADVADALTDTNDLEKAEGWLREIPPTTLGIGLGELAAKVGSAYFLQGNEERATEIFAAFHTGDGPPPYVDEATGEMVFPLSQEEKDALAALLEQDHDGGAAS